MKFLLPEIDNTESSSREGLEIQINKSDDRKIGYYAAVYNKYGYQVSETQYAFRKRELKQLEITDFTIEEVES